MIDSISAARLPELGMTRSTGTGTGTGGASAPSEAGGFASMLKDIASSSVQTLRQGESAAIAGMKGDVPLQTVVENVMAAERTLQASIAIRDKVVSAYLEISRMQI